MENVEETKKKIEEAEKISKDYFAAINKRVTVAQETGDIPTDFVYSYAEQTWVLTLPQSVMAQKRLLHAQDEMVKTGSYEAEEAFIRLIAQNVRVNNSPLNIDMYDIGAIEVLKTAYMDCLLLPLSLGGDRALKNYMKSTIANAA